MKIGILDYSTECEIEKKILGDSAEFFLYNATRNEDLPDNIDKLDAVLVWHHIKVDRTIIARLTKCKVIVRIGTGYDSVDIKSAGASGIPVLNIPDYGTEDVAEHALALMLALNRSIVTYHENLKKNVYKNWVASIGGFIPRLSGKTIGIIGLGRIGTAMAIKCRGLGMSVLFYDPYKEDGYDKALHFERCQSPEEIFSRSDFVSLHPLLTAETSGMVNKELLKNCKEGMMLINTSRGKVVKNDAVFAALKTGKLRAFAADVLEVEPPDIKNDLLVKAYVKQEDFLQNRMLLTPHAAFYAVESRLEMRSKAAEAIKLIMNNLPLRNCVNKEYLINARYPIV